MRIPISFRERLCDYSDKGNPDLPTAAYKRFYYYVLAMGLLAKKSDYSSVN